MQANYNFTFPTQIPEVTNKASYCITFLLQYSTPPHTLFCLFSTLLILASQPHLEKKTKKKHQNRTCKYLLFSVLQV